jgi:hypothetical protein
MADIEKAESGGVTEKKSKPKERAKAAPPARERPRSSFHWRDEKTPKLSEALEAVELDNVDAIVAACKDGSKPGATRDEIASAMADVQDLDHELADALRRNSSYRGKGDDHSLRVAAQWLEAHHGADSEPADQ